jgi:hypothetical protein
MRASMFGFACFAGSVFVGVAGAARGESGNPDFRIPIAAGRQVDASWRSTRPDLIDSFDLRNGADWYLYWDQRLETPRYLAPRNRPVIAQGVSDEKALIAKVLEFADSNQEFFGVSSRDLLDPVVGYIDRSRLVIFREGAGGLPVRGASLRVQIDPSGAIASVDSFLLRNPQAFAVQAAQTVNEDTILATARSNHAAEMGSLEQQVVFPTDDPRSAVPGWRLKATYSDGRATEIFLTSGGAELGELDLAQHFEGEIQVRGHCPDPNNIYLPANQFTPNTTYPIRDVRIFVSSGWRGITGDLGIGYPNGPWSEENAWATLEMGMMDQGPEPCLNYVHRTPGEDEVLNEDGIRTLIRVINAANCDLPSDPSLIGLVPSEKLEMDPSTPIIMTFNETFMSDWGSFNLLAYNHVRKLMVESMARIEELKTDISLKDQLPINILSHFDSMTPFYTFKDCKATICMAPSISAQNWITPTMVHHEYAHHVIHTVLKSAQSSDFTEGVADVMTAYLNGNPRIGYIEQDFPGPLGFRLDTMDVTDWRGMVGKTFWRIFQTEDEANDPTRIVNEEPFRQLFYRWLADRRVSTDDQIAFDASGALLMQILVADDEINGDHNFWNGTLYEDRIKGAFNSIESFKKPFIRGDADHNGQIDLTDVVDTLDVLFLGGKEVGCLEAMDVDRSFVIDISDAIYLLAYLFNDGLPPASPFPGCGGPELFRYWCIDTAELCKLSG